MFKPKLVVCSLLLCLFNWGCSIVIDGDFSEIPFTPNETGFGVVNKHHIASSGYATPRDQEDWDAELFFSSIETESVFEDWRFLDQESRLALKRELATGHTLWIKDIALGEMELGKALSSEAAQFEMLVVQNPPLDESRPLGKSITAELVFQESAWEENGYAKGELVLKRQKQENQPNYTATGTIRIEFKVPLVGERIAESNLSFISPILVCAAHAGQMSAECITAH